MSVSQIITSLDVITQLPLDKKTYFKTKSDLTFYGVDDVDAFKYYEGMTVYCLETDSFYRWLDIDKPKDPSYEKVGYPFKYPTNIIVNDINYSGRTFEFFRVTTSVDLSALEAELDKKVDAALDASREYSDILNRQAEDREQNLKDALQGTMDANQAQNILDLENAKRELYKQMADTSDQLVEDLDNLKDDFNKQANDVQESLDNMKDTLDNIPTDQILTDVQLDNLKYLRNTISQEYADIDFKFERVLRDSFLPEHLRPGLLDLQEQGQIKHTELVNVINQALEDKKITQEEKDLIDAKMNEFRALNDVINTTILGAYDDINANMDEYFKDRLADTMKEVQLYFEYSRDGRTAWHKDFVEGDKYMRMKNGINGTWSDSIKIVGENGTGGRYTDYQFSKNKSLYQAPETGWSDAPPEVEPDEYLWMRVGEVMPPMTYPEYWTTVRMSGPQGHPGIQGEQGLPGKPGVDGKTPYTHIAYASGPNGEGFSQTSNGNTTHVGFYHDFIEVDSSDPSKYVWTLIKGHDGTQGLPGPAGPDGTPTYLHIAYANSADGKVGFSIVDGVGKSYLGQYVDSIKADSTDPTKYTWTLIKGEKGDQGERGLQGLQGSKGDQGIPGTKGADGKTSYTHIAYADTASGGGFSQNAAGKAYVGMYVDFTAADSTDPTKYKWSLIKGADGANGIPGKAGADGRTPYFHIAYANSADGVKDFSTTVSTNKLFIGTYTDFVQADSTTPSKYKWARMRDERVISATEPTNKYIGLTWIDTSKVPIQEKYWTGSAWNLIGISESGIANMIKDANDALQAVMNDALEDGIITNNEARNIAENIAVLESNKRQLDVKYNTIYGDPKLGASHKTTLLSRKTAFDTAHTNLLNVCKAIAKKTSITPAELTDYNTKQTAYNTQLTELGKALDNAQANIYLNNISGIEVGGRNLLLKSGVKITNSSYNIRNYNLVSSHTFKNGDDYIVTIWGSLGAGKSSFMVYNTGTASSMATLQLIEPGVYRSYFKWSNRQGDATTENTVLRVYANPNSGTVNSTIDRIKLEKGTNPSDWTPAHEDQQEEINTAIANAAQAKSIAEGARNATSFLTTTADPKTGLITGGALLVGDATGNNAGIVGVTDKGVESVRLYSGTTYSKKDTAPFRVLNNGRLYASNAFISGNINATSGFFGGFKITVNSFESSNGVLHIDSATGMQTLKDANGVVRNRKGLNASGEPMDTWYDADGNERYSLTSRGIIYKQYVAESYGEEIIGFIGTTLTVATATTALGWLYKTLTNYWGPAQQGPNQAAMWTVEGSWNPGGPAIYSYSAGVNETSENNKQYEGFYYTGKNKLGAKVANGWYLSKTHYGQVYGFTEMMQPDGSTTLEELPSYVSKTFSAFRISAGKKVESKTISAMTQWNMMGQTINGTPVKVPVSGVTIV